MRRAVCRSAILLSIALPSVGLLGGCAASTQAPATTPAPPSGAATASAKPQTPPATMQYLFGSGEAGAVSVQAFNALIGYARAKVASRPSESVVLAPESTLDAPSYVPCGDKPFAAVFDVDETMILNLGYEWNGALKGSDFDAASWARWEKTGADKVAPLPGAVSAVNALRNMGVTVIFNTNRSAASAEQTAAAIKFAGLGEAVHGQTLFLAGDDAMGSKKDGRRATIAAKYCVIAMGGDQLGDFSDLFNQDGMNVSGRRMEVIAGWVAQKWGNGWFVLPNPVYGSGLKGGFDDVFPKDLRWTDPEGGK